MICPVTSIDTLKKQIAACEICADRFASTQTAHVPRPVTWFAEKAPILIAGQAPGARVHASGIPFDDPSGDRLRDWLGVDRDTFYDTANFAILPMAFCFPGYKNGADLPPPAICAKTWRHDVLKTVDRPELTLLIGGYAQKWHLKTKLGVTECVKNWERHLPEVLPLPHPSWRNTAWIAKNPWFETTLIPRLQEDVARLLGPR